MASETGRFVATDGESDPTIELLTSNGMRLSRVEMGVYEVIQIWRILRSSDPAAPQEAEETSCAPCFVPMDEQAIGPADRSGRIPEYSGGTPSLFLQFPVIREDHILGCVLCGNEGSGISDFASLGQSLR